MMCAATVQMYVFLHTYLQHHGKAVCPAACAAAQQGSRPCRLAHLHPTTHRSIAGPAHGLLQVLLPSCAEGCWLGGSLQSSDELWAARGHADHLHVGTWLGDCYWHSVANHLAVLHLVLTAVLCECM
jgi:hypothetical protein